tara:strand:+ start:19255 stop:19494 length:240 start_codon:yes stop_codon:yes gene_type:complete
MSHPGNDTIIDNKRDTITIDASRIKLIDDMVYVATKMGIGVVQEIAAETLNRKPGMSVKEFTKVLDEYLEKQEELKNRH